MFYLKGGLRFLFASFLIQCHCLGSAVVALLLFLLLCYGFVSLVLLFTHLYVRLLVGAFDISLVSLAKVLGTFLPFTFTCVLVLCSLK